MIWSSFWSVLRSCDATVSFLDCAASLSSLLPFGSPYPQKRTLPLPNTPSPSSLGEFLFFLHFFFSSFYLRLTVLTISKQQASKTHSTLRSAASTPSATITTTTTTAPPAAATANPPAVGWWARLELTAGLRPQLTANESELLVQNNVGLYQDKKKAPLFQLGRAYLTTKRICYVDAERPHERSLELLLTHIGAVEYYGGFMRSSAKITITVAGASAAGKTGNGAPLSLVLRNGEDSGAPRMAQAQSDASSSSSSSSSVSLPLRQQQHEQVLQELQTRDTGQAPPAAPAPASTTTPGPLRRRKLPFHEVSWVCPICFFANSLPRDFEWPDAPANELPPSMAQLRDPEGYSMMPPCSTCGIKPTRRVVFQAIEQILGPTTATPSAPATPTRLETPAPTSKANSTAGVPDLMMMVTDDDTTASIPSLSNAATNPDPDASNGSSKRKSKKDDGFACPRCTFINHPSLNFCEICGARLISAHLPPQLNRVMVQGQSTVPSAAPSSTKKPTSTSSSNGVVLQYDDDGYLVSLLGSDTPADSFSQQAASASASPSTAPSYKLSFRSGGDKQFYEALKQQLNARSQTDTSKTTNNQNSINPTLKQGSLDGKTLSGQQTAQSAADSSKRLAVGIHGLQLSDETKRERNREVLGAGLEDMTKLMARAKDLIKLAEDYAKLLEHTPTSHLAAGSASSSVSLAAAQQARRELAYSTQALGLNSTVVTKDMVASEDSKLYYAELARQIAEFLMDNKHWHASTTDLYGAGASSTNTAKKQQDKTSVLDREGGIITLFDLFAVYNRARGVALVSPKDLVSACNLFAELQLPVSLRKFRSGLTVVQEAYKTPDVIIRSMRRWMAQRGAEFRKLRGDDNRILPFEGTGVTAADVSDKFKWSVMIATEELEMAEERGVLCRDEQVSGTVFYENLFLESPDRAASDNIFSWDWKRDVFGETQ